MSVRTNAGKGLIWAAKSRSKSKVAGVGARSTRAANATSKLRGELAEMMFMVKATQKGFATAKPYGDSRRYDFIVAVQVKSSIQALQRSLPCVCEPAFGAGVFAGIADG